MSGPGIAAVVAALIAAAPPAPERASVEGAKIHIEATRRHRGALYLYAYELDVTPARMMTKVSEREQQVCSAPCDRVVDVSRSPEFYVAGPKVTRSRTFSLPRDGAGHVSVKPGSRPQYVAGWVVAITGAAAALAGATLMAVSNRDPQRLRVGGATLGGGALVLTIGAVLVGTGRTHVEVQPR